jgi:hypothetical protein
MITEGEKKYLEHAIELAEFIDQQNMTGNLKSEILDKMLIPYGLSDEKKNDQKQVPKEQPVQQQKHSPTESVMDIVNAHKDKMRIDGHKVMLTAKIDDYWAVVDEFKHRGWKHVQAEKLSNGKWKDGYFEPAGAKA